MKRLGGFVGGVIVGAGVMYLMDPRGGRRRRALIRDRVTHQTRELADAAGEARVRVGNRVKGIVHETRSRFSRQDVDDSVLEARVRSALGRSVSNPGAISVIAENGSITITGPVLASEASALLRCVGRVHGVREVNNRLTVRSDAGNSSGLQGSDRRPGNDLNTPWG